jgi:hypothetical protein
MAVHVPTCCARRTCGAETSPAPTSVQVGAPLAAGTQSAHAAPPLAAGTLTTYVRVCTSAGTSAQRHLTAWCAARTRGMTGTTSWWLLGGAATCVPAPPQSPPAHSSQAPQSPTHSTGAQGSMVQSCVEVSPAAASHATPPYAASTLLLYARVCSGSAVQWGYNGVGKCEWWRQRGAHLRAGLATVAGAGAAVVSPPLADAVNGRAGRHAAQSRCLSTYTQC